MRKVLTLGIVLMGLQMLQAQVEVPAPSPLAKLEQKVGLTEVTVEYSRPGVKNRKVFGKLVPYGEMWRTGANASTKVTFSNDVVVEGNKLEKGSYALFTIPGEIDWEVIFYTDTETWGVPREYDESKEAARFTVTSEELPWTIETMLIDVGNLRDASATLTLYWESIMVPIDIQFGTDAMVQEKIETVLAGPSGRDYYLAARYYFANDKDINQAKEWIEIANEKDPKFWQLRLESLIHAKDGDYTSAIKTAKESKEMAMEAGNENYVRMNEASIEEWEMKMKEPAKMEAKPMDKAMDK
ncbi:MAG: DUF2911 domain-containing protein [Saprospiraceae bacterium]|nr:DUF2911 domain-containing protein [Saprospiraceae bacterium]